MDAVIPATVTIPGEQMFELIVCLERAALVILKENARCETAGTEELFDVSARMFETAFGRSFFPCDCGETVDVDCPCNTPEGNMTPLYRLMCQRAAEGHESFDLFAGTELAATVTA